MSEITVGIHVPSSYSTRIYHGDFYRVRPELGRDQNGLIAAGHLASYNIFNKAPFSVDPLTFYGSNLPKDPGEKLSVLIGKDAMRRNLGERGVAVALGDPPLHLIDSEDDARILIGAGIAAYKKLAGTKNGHAPFFFGGNGFYSEACWAALEKEGVSGVISDPRQFAASDNSQRVFDNTPSVLRLINGHKDHRTVVVIPYSAAITDSLSGSDKHNADAFVQRHFVPALDGWAPNEASKERNFSWTDATIYGERWPRGDQFLKWLLDHSLPQIATVVSVNQISVTQDLPEVRLREGLPLIANPLIEAHKELNMDISYLLRDFMGDNKEDYIREMQKMYIDALRNKGRNLHDDGLRNTYRNENIPPVDFLKSAKAVALLGLCSVLRGSEDNTISMQNSILNALQVIAYIQDAGLMAAAARMREAYLERIGTIVNPSDSSQNGADFMREIEGKVGPREHVLKYKYSTI